MPSIPSAFAAFRTRWPHLAGRRAVVVGTLHRTMLQSLPPQKTVGPGRAAVKPAAR